MVDTKMANNEDSVHNDPNFAVICSFIERFGDLCGLGDITVLELQEKLEDSKNVCPEWVDLHVRLLRKAGKKSVYHDRWEKALVKFCHGYSKLDAWEIERFGYKKAKLSVKINIFKHLLEAQFDNNSKFKTEVNKCTAKELRIIPAGRDINGQMYWYQLDKELNLRIYREDQDDETWELVAREKAELSSLIDTLKASCNQFKKEESTTTSENDDSKDSDATKLIKKPKVDTGQEVEAGEDKEKIEKVELNDDSKAEVLSLHQKIVTGNDDKSVPLETDSSVPIKTEPKIEIEIKKEQLEIPSIEMSIKEEDREPRTVVKDLVVCESINLNKDSSLMKQDSSLGVGTVAEIPQRASVIKIAEKIHETCSIKDQVLDLQCQTKVPSKTDEQIHDNTFNYSAHEQKSVHGDSICSDFVKDSISKDASPIKESDGSLNLTKSSDSNKMVSNLIMEPAKNPADSLAVDLSKHVSESRATLKDMEMTFQLKPRQEEMKDKIKSDRMIPFKKREIPKDVDMCITSDSDRMLSTASRLCPDEAKDPAESLPMESTPTKSSLSKSVPVISHSIASVLTDSDKSKEDCNYWKLPVRSSNNFIASMTSKNISEDILPLTMRKHVLANQPDQNKSLKSNDSAAEGHDDSMPMNLTNLHDTNSTKIDLSHKSRLSEEVNAKTCSNKEINQTDALAEIKNTGEKMQKLECSENKIGRCSRKDNNGLPIFDVNRFSERKELGCERAPESEMNVNKKDLQLQHALNINDNKDHCTGEQNKNVLGINKNLIFGESPLNLEGKSNWSGSITENNFALNMSTEPDDLAAKLTWEIAKKKQSEGKVDSKFQKSPFDKNKKDGLEFFSRKEKRKEIGKLEQSVAKLRERKQIAFGKEQMKMEKQRAIISDLISHDKLEKLKAAEELPAQQQYQCGTELRKLNDDSSSKVTKDLTTTKVPTENIAKEMDERICSVPQKEIKLTENLSSDKMKVPLGIDMEKTIKQNSHSMDKIIARPDEAALCLVSGTQEKHKLTSGKEENNEKLITIEKNFESNFANKLETESEVNKKIIEESPSFEKNSVHDSGNEKKRQLDADSGKKTQLDADSKKLGEVESKNKPNLELDATAKNATESDIINKEKVQDSHNKQPMQSDESCSERNEMGPKSGLESSKTKNKDGKQGLEFVEKSPVATLSNVKDDAMDKIEDLATKKRPDNDNVLNIPKDEKSIDKSSKTLEKSDLIENDFRFTDTTKEKAKSSDETCKRDIAKVLDSVEKQKVTIGKDDGNYGMQIKRKDDDYLIFSNKRQVDDISPEKQLRRSPPKIIPSIDTIQVRDILEEAKALSSEKSVLLKESNVEEDNERKSLGNQKKVEEEKSRIQEVRKEEESKNQEGGVEVEAKINEGEKFRKQEKREDAKSQNKSEQVKDKQKEQNKQEKNKQKEVKNHENENFEESKNLKLNDGKESKDFAANQRKLPDSKDGVEKELCNTDKNKDKVEDKMASEQTKFENSDQDKVKKIEDHDQDKQKKIENQNKDKQKMIENPEMDKQQKFKEHAFDYQKESKAHSLEESIGTEIKKTGEEAFKFENNRFQLGKNSRGKYSDIDSTLEKVGTEKGKRKKAAFRNRPVKFNVGSGSIELAYSADVPTDKVKPTLTKEPTLTNFSIETLAVEKGLKPDANSQVADKSAINIDKSLKHTISEPEGSNNTSKKEEIKPVSPDQNVLKSKIDEELVAAGEPRQKVASSQGEVGKKISDVDSEKDSVATKVSSDVTTTRNESAVEDYDSKLVIDLAKSTSLDEDKHVEGEDSVAPLLVKEVMQKPSRGRRGRHRGRGGSRGRPRAQARKAVSDGEKIDAFLKDDSQDMPLLEESMPAPQVKKLSGRGRKNQSKRGRSKMSPTFELSLSTPVKRSPRLQAQREKQEVELRRMEEERRIIAEYEQIQREEERRKRQEMKELKAAKRNGEVKRGRGRPRKETKLDAAAEEEEDEEDEEEDEEEDDDEDDDLEEECDKESKKRKKSKKKKRRQRRRRKGNNPWDYSSESSTSSSSSEHEEHHEEEEDEELVFNDKSDHEFSPESESEVDSSQPTKIRRARTARKMKSDSDDESEENRGDDKPCSKCSNYDHPEWILLCDKCDAGFHTACLRPPLLIIPDGDWYCPPCEHTMLLLALQEHLKFLDQALKKKEREEMRKKRLAYVGINLDNVLKTQEKKEISENEEDEDDHPKRSCRARKEISYRFKEYDEMIQSAIQEELIAERGAGLGKGKDMANITEAEEKEELLKKKRKHRRLNDLDSTDESETDSDEDFKQSSDGVTQPSEEEEEDYVEDSDESWHSGRRRSNPSRHSSRKRRGYDDFVCDEDESDDSESHRSRRRVASKRISYRELSDSDDDDEKWNKSIQKRRKIESSEESSEESDWRSSHRKGIKPFPKQKRTKRRWASESEDDSGEDTRKTRGKKMSYEESFESDASDVDNLKVQKKKHLRIKDFAKDSDDDDEEEESGEDEDDEDGEEDDKETEEGGSSDENDAQHQKGTRIVGGVAKILSSDSEVSTADDSGAKKWSVIRSLKNTSAKNEIESGGEESANKNAMKPAEDQVKEGMSTKSESSNSFKENGMRTERVGVDFRGQGNPVGQAQVESGPSKLTLLDTCTSQASPQSRLTMLDTYSHRPTSPVPHSFDPKLERPQSIQNSPAPQDAAHPPPPHPGIPPPAYTGDYPPFGGPYYPPNYGPQNSPHESYSPQGYTGPAQPLPPPSQSLHAQPHPFPPPYHQQSPHYSYGPEGYPEEDQYEGHSQPYPGYSSYTSPMGPDPQTQPPPTGNYAVNSLLQRRIDGAGEEDEFNGVNDLVSYITGSNENQL